MKSTQKHGLNIPQNGALDFLSLGALVHRLDPGISRQKRSNNRPQFRLRLEVESEQPKLASISVTKLLLVLAVLIVVWLMNSDRLLEWLLK
jgi:hypothetical protein